MQLRHLRRGSLTRVIGAAGLALLAGWAVAAAVARANDLAAAYGTRTSVVVAAHDLAIGASIADGDLRTVELPLALVAGTPVGRPQGRTVVEPILDGEVVVGERLAPDGLTGPVALAPSGTRALAVPTPAGRPPIALGDRVDVIAVAVDGTRTQRTAEAAVVVAIDDDAVTVAIEADEVTATARAALDATAVLALRGGP